MEDKRVVQRNFWAIASLVIGIISLLLSFFAPVPLVPFNFCSFPLGLVSMIMGFLVHRGAKQMNDTTSATQARWGIGLGCASWMFNICWYSFAISTWLAIFAAAIFAALSGTSSSTP